MLTFGNFSLITGFKNCVPNKNIEIKLEGHTWSHVKTIMQNSAKDSKEMFILVDYTQGRLKKLAEYMASEISHVTF